MFRRSRNTRENSSLGFEHYVVCSFHIANNISVCISSSSEGMLCSDRSIISRSVNPRLRLTFVEFTTFVISLISTVVCFEIYSSLQIRVRIQGTKSTVSVSSRLYNTQGRIYNRGDFAYRSELHFNTFQFPLFIERHIPKKFQIIIYSSHISSSGTVLAPTMDKVCTTNRLKNNRLNLEAFNSYGSIVLWLVITFCKPFEWLLFVRSLFVRLSTIVFFIRHFYKA